MSSYSEPPGIEPFVLPGMVIGAVVSSFSFDTFAAWFLGTAILGPLAAFCVGIIWLFACYPVLLIFRALTRRV